MTQTDDIHESFYDLFNQHFRKIDDPRWGTRYYANIAIGAHMKLCHVHPNFQCVVVIKKSEVQNTPAPFLNRFEKYCITHRSLLKEALSHLPPCFRIIIETAMEKARIVYQINVKNYLFLLRGCTSLLKYFLPLHTYIHTNTQVQDFLDCISAPSSLYGLQPETLDSLVLSVLPPLTHSYEPFEEPSAMDENLELKVLLMQELLQNLCRHFVGLHIPPVSDSRRAIAFL